MASATPLPMCRDCRVNDFGVRDLIQPAPALQRIANELVNIFDVRGAIQNLLQALKAAALNAHLLGMGQRPGDPPLAQGECKTFLESFMEFGAARMAGFVLAGNQLPFGDLDLLRTGTRGAAPQN